MELLQLKYFLELARSEHLSKTAEKLMISPPSLSSTIRKLEGELGTPLFDRSRQRMHLNEKGKIFYRYVEESLGTLKMGVEAVSPPKGPELFVAMTSQPIYSNMLYQYEQAHPCIQMHSFVIPIDVLNQPREMEKYNFYCGIIEDIDKERFMYRQVWEHERPVVLISRKNPLADREELELKELKNESFISVLPENTSAHHYMMRIFEQEQFHPKKIYYGGYLMRVKMVSENQAVAITTSVGAAVNSIPLQSIAMVPLKGDLPVRTQAVCWDKRKKLTEEERDFIYFAEEYFQKLPGGDIAF